MQKAVFKDLLTQQVNVLRTISYLAASFMAAYLGVLYFGFGIKNQIPAIILFYVVGILVNILLFPLHKRAYITYYALIIMTWVHMFTMLIHTGGMISPFMFVLISLPAYAFYTSRSQGKIWFVITTITVLVVFQADKLGIPVKNIIPEYYFNTLVLFNFMFILIQNSVYTLLSKREALKVHKSRTSLELDLKGKSKRLENMVMLVNYSTELMCVIDQKELTFDELNPTFKIELGYELSELRDKHVSTLLKEETIPFLSSAQEDQLLEFVSSVLTLSGEIKLYSWLVVAKNGKLYASARDIS